MRFEFALKGTSSFKCGKKCLLKCWKQFENCNKIINNCNILLASPLLEESPEKQTVQL